MAYEQPDGYMALPPINGGKPVLVLHAWWGLNETIKAFCNRLAGVGFTVFAPDLYHGQLADTIPGAEALGSALDENEQQAKEEVVQAARFLLQRAGAQFVDIAVVGFSLGAYYALDLSNAEPDLVNKVAVFYGSGPQDYSPSQAAYLGHFAENDPFEPPANVDALEESLQRAGRPVTVYRYPGVGHWFFEPDRVGSYDEAAAGLAWERTLVFLRQ